MAITAYTYTVEAYAALILLQCWLALFCCPLRQSAVITTVSPTEPEIHSHDTEDRSVEDADLPKTSEPVRFSIL